jgi:hypothetical protein
VVLSELLIAGGVRYTVCLWGIARFEMPGKALDWTWGHLEARFACSAARSIDIVGGSRRPSVFILKMAFKSILCYGVFQISCFLLIAVNGSDLCPEA